MSSAVPSLEELLTADPDQFVAKYTDIAAVNLGCARGLSNCDESAFPDYLALLDIIAEAVKKQTEKQFRLFKLKPQEFLNSENVFRVYTMEYVFRAQFGIKYDPTVRQTLSDVDGQRDMSKSWQSADSSEIFIHGLLSDKRAGTCSSLPTFAIAVGRRLGYPLKLILVPNHTLYRWDDGTEVFNLQPNEAGGEVKEDAYFHTWPRKWTREDFDRNTRTNVWLRSLTPKKEVSKFLCNRVLMLRDFRRFDEALQAIDAAQRFDPINPACSDIRRDIEDVMDGGDLADYGNRGRKKYVGGSGVNAELPPTQFDLSLPSHSENTGFADASSGAVVTGLPPLTPSPAKVDRAASDRRRREQAAFADEHYRLVNLINESNRNRSPQFPDGNPPSGPLHRQLNDLLQSRYRKEYAQ